MHVFVCLFIFFTLFPFTSIFLAAPYPHHVVGVQPILARGMSFLWLLRLVTQTQCLKASQIYSPTDLEVRV